MVTHQLLIEAFHQKEKVFFLLQVTKQCGNLLQKNQRCNVSMLYVSISITTLFTPAHLVFMQLVRTFFLSKEEHCFLTITERKEQSNLVVVVQKSKEWMNL